MKSIATNYQDQVCQDSCVELFISPKASRRLDFEFNCGGVMLNYYIEDPTRVAALQEVHPGARRPARARHCEIDDATHETPIEIAEPIEWRLEAGSRCRS